MALINIGRTAEQVGGAVAQVAEVFTSNATKAEAAATTRYTAAITQAGAEFEGARDGWFDQFVNGLNRLPRPLLAISTIGLFAYAMAAPEGFSVRMQGLAYVPDPLWWLLGAVVSFYFGARELHYFRGYAPRVPAPAVPNKALTSPQAEINDALEDWRANL
ncbi:holin family protein [Abyssibius alkaniclasticus]|uniref:holin family protein n=1 Tax=Abyssibius alkaniclasticus TaxID=2881234 RepID=UPI00236350E1|nr:holin family protein [Abyssibius alkaniclasticus]UPH70517.1 holin family protein [Abyssibius alkaniclasticus]|tara:strand:- start:1404 stop:1886 length:483 start_codon:yes stop_codon:yes gene_type:complete